MHDTRWNFLINICLFNFLRDQNLFIVILGDFNTFLKRVLFFFVIIEDYVFHVQAIRKLCLFIHISLLDAAFCKRWVVSLDGVKYKFCPLQYLRWLQTFAHVDTNKNNRRFWKCLLNNSGWLFHYAAWRIDKFQTERIHNFVFESVENFEAHLSC